jgi:tRNA wybutosine-synthesizing protein 3
MYKLEKFKSDALNKDDKSSIGSWDRRIVELCNKINEDKNYCTTSSCSGRLSLIKDNNKKMHGLFLWRSHEKTSFEELKKEIEKASKQTEDTVYFKQEPCLVTVACKDIESQRKLFDIAKNNGWKKSGIVTTQKKFILELMSSENISLPVITRGEILISDKYIKLLVKEANKKLEKTWEKIDRLKGLL